MKNRLIPRSEWSSFFDAFTRRHVGWLATVWVVDPRLGAQVEARGLPFEAVDLDPSAQGPISLQLGALPRVEHRAPDRRARAGLGRAHRRRHRSGPGGPVSRRAEDHRRVPGPGRAGSRRLRDLLRVKERCAQAPDSTEIAGAPSVRSTRSGVPQSLHPTSGISVTARAAGQASRIEREKLDGRSAA